jgi:CheY-like chemotaxis protein
MDFLLGRPHFAVVTEARRFRRKRPTWGKFTCSRLFEWVGFLLDGSGVRCLGQEMGMKPNLNAALQRTDVCREPIILLVEDKPGDAMAVESAFRELNLSLRLMVVHDGREAMHYLAGAGPYADRADFTLPSLILLYLHTPYMDGFEFLEWLRGQPGFEWVPVVALTGSCFSRDVDRAYQLGANSFVSKPPDLKTLESELKEVLEHWVPEFRTREGIGVGDASLERAA